MLRRQEGVDLEPKVTEFVFTAPAMTEVDLSLEPAKTPLDDGPSSTKAKRSTDESKVTVVQGHLTRKQRHLTPGLACLATSAHWTHKEWSATR